MSFPGSSVGKRSAPLVETPAASPLPRRCCRCCRCCPRAAAGITAGATRARPPSTSTPASPRWREVSARSAAPMATGAPAAARATRASGSGGRASSSALTTAWTGALYPCCGSRTTRTAHQAGCRSSARRRRLDCECTHSAGNMSVNSITHLKL